MRGLYELLISLITLCGIVQIYLLHTNLSLSVLLFVDAIILVGFFEGIVFHRGVDQEQNEERKRIVWTFILLLANLVIFIGMNVEGSVVGILGAGFLLIFMNFEQLGAFLVFRYDNRKLTEERDLV